MSFFKSKLFKVSCCLLFAVCISSCDEMELCFYNDDFGESSNKDSFYVYTSETNCYFNQSVAHNDPGQSYTVQKCIIETDLNTMATAIDGIYGTDLVNDINKVSFKGNTCSYADPNNTGNEVTPQGTTTESEANTIMTAVYDKCVTYCTDKCESAGSSIDSQWTKASLKTSKSYLGIKLTTNSYVYVTVSGTIILTAENNSSSATYSKIGINDVSYDKQIAGGDYLQLALDYNKSTLSNFSNDINNLKNRTVVFLESVKSDLVLSDASSAYNYQQPKYKLLKCDYFEKDVNTKMNNKNCYFDFSKSDIEDNIKDTLSSYYNKNYLMSIFGIDYYIYANNFIDNIYYTGDDGNVISTNEKLVSVRSGKEIILESNNQYVDGYILNGSSISFNISNASKIAIKYIGTATSNVNCKLSALTTNNYKIVKEGDVNNVALEEKVYDNIIYNATPIITSSTDVTNNNVWKTLKTSVGTDGEQKEIVFNQFSTPYKQITSKITLTLSEDSDSTCNGGLLIKIIPLKDYEVTKSGLLFFDFVDMGSGDNVSYNIINPEVLYKNSLDDLSIKVNDFYEYTEAGSTLNKTLNFGEWQSLPVVDSGDLDRIDSNIFPSDSVLHKKYVFVRKGQYIRFDYTNWFEIDDKNNIELKITSVDSIDIDKIVGIHALIKERPSYICAGNYKESLDVKTECSSMGGDYESFYTSADNTKIENRCYITAGECTASKELVSEFQNINKYAQDCKYTTAKSNEFINEMKLSEFWSNVYTSYSSKCSDKDGKEITCYKQCYHNLIEKILNQTKKCQNVLNSENYTVYKGNVVCNDGVCNESHRESFNIDIDLKNVIKAGDGVITDVTGSVNSLNDFFVISSANGGNIRSALYYYKNICSIDNTTGLCYTNAIPMCYDLTNYIGSTLNFLKRTLEHSKGTISAGTINTYGTMTNNDVQLGAERISYFNGNSGLIKNFAEDSNANASDNYVRLKYTNSIYVNNTAFLGVYILNVLNDVSKFNEYFIYTDVKDTILKLQSDAKKTYKNGANLAVMIGENSKKYYSNEANNSIYYYDSGNEVSVTSTINGSDNIGKHIVELVKYKKSNSETIFDNLSPYKFNDKGELVTVNGSMTGIDFANFDLGKAYIESNKSDGVNPSDKNLFFKIIDADANIGNNEGRYRVVVKEYNNSESGIITYFRDFFNNILQFIDGAYIKLYKNTATNTLVSCSSNNSDAGKCYIYNEDDVSNNGSACSVDDDNCYEGCDGIGSNDINRKCISVYDGKGFVKGIYETFINDPLYIFVAKILLVLSITWYGFGYFLGMSEFKQSEIIPKIIKVSFIYFMISPSGWNFFNNYIIKFFKECIDNVLFLIAGSFESDLGSELTQAIQQNNYTDKTVLFSGCFTNLEMIFSDAVFNKILGLAFSGWVGLIYLYLVFSAVINYVIASLSAMIMYLSAQVYMSLIFCFFPLVVLFMFFKKTEKTFDNWLGLLIGFAGQQVFLIMTLSFFNLLIYNFIRTTFSYTVCWLSIFNINVGGIPLAAIMFWKIPGTTMSSTGINTGNEAMPSFYSIITFYMVGVLMGKFITEMASIGNSIFGGMSMSGGIASTLTDGLNKAGAKLTQSMKQIGSTFASGVANRLGGKAIKEFGDKQRQEIVDRRQKRNEHFKDVKKQTSKDMDNFKKDAIDENKRKEDKTKKEENDKTIKELEGKKNNGDKLTEEEQKKYDEAVKSNKEIKDREEYYKNYKIIENGNSKNATKEEKKAAKEAEERNSKLLARKQKEFAYNNEVDSVMKKYGEDMKDAYIANGGSEEQWNNIDEDDKRQMAIEYGTSRGLIGDKPEEVNKPKNDTPRSEASGGQQGDNPPSNEQNDGSGNDGGDGDTSSSGEQSDGSGNGDGSNNNDEEQTNSIDA
ncbi:MAG: type IV secretion system protein [Rickettsiales bacterium]|nr:type IV secretion system protein [Rickettsiales bacterium]